jgi:transposase
MRVPATLAEAKTLLETTDPQTLQALVEGYHYASVTSSYGEVEQRWLIIHSQAAQARASKSVSKQALALTEKERKAFERLCRKAFACEQDAKAALEVFQHELKVLTIHEARVVEIPHYGKSGRPSQDSVPETISYHLQGILAAPIGYYQAQLARASMFILASNELDVEALSDEDILAGYKAQSKVERGFRFLKDPMFLASTIFLKKVQRVMALLMVMTLCLLVYAALEHRIRTTLKVQQNRQPCRTKRANLHNIQLLDGSSSSF